MLPFDRSGEPRFHIFPETDTHLGREIRKAYCSAPESLSDAARIAFVEAALRSTYRLMSIRSQHPLGRTPGADRVWYVFRDGGVRRSNAQLDRLYGALATARDLRQRTIGSIESACDTARDAGYRVEADLARTALRQRPFTTGSS
jgi:hypothetical protein